MLPLPAGYVLQRFNHVPDDTRAPFSSLLRELREIYRSASVRLVRNGADDNKGRVVRIASLRYRRAIHLTAQAAKIGYYPVILLFAGDKLVAVAYPAIKNMDIRRGLLHRLYRSGATANTSARAAQSALPHSLANREFLSFCPVKKQPLSKHI